MRLKILMLSHYGNACSIRDAGCSLIKLNGPDVEDVSRNSIRDYEIQEDCILHPKIRFYEIEQDCILHPKIRFYEIERDCILHPKIRFYEIQPDCIRHPTSHQITENIIILTQLGEINMVPVHILHEHIII